jgi:hypothetical protein
MPLSDIFNASNIKNENIQLRDENEKLKKLIQDLGATDAIEIRKRMETLKIEEQRYTDELNKVKLEADTKKKQFSDEINKLEFELSEKKKLIISVDDELMLESFALYMPHFSFQKSEEYKQRLDVIREEQKRMIKSGIAATGNLNWTVNGSKTEGKKMVNDTIKLVLRSFNNECDYCVDNVRFHNIESHEKRINASYDALIKLGKIMNVTISPEYKRLKMDELHLAHEYQQKKEEEKEELRRLREEIREQEKLEKEIKIARERIAKERKHFSNAIEELKMRIENVTSDVELKELNQKLSEIQAQYSSLDQEEKQLDYREQNAKAGYVYVISNLGSFGENIFKIGMTRRLEPIERIHELSNASVPFPFDVHTLIFSDNAPDLEAKIKNTFHHDRLNKINNRKEFFKADINELEKVIRLNYNKVVDFDKHLMAEQFRESLLVKE